MAPVARERYENCRDRFDDEEQRAERMHRERQLRKACSEGRMEQVRELLTAGVSPSCANSSGSTPLHEAAYEGCLQVCSLLLDAGAEVNEVDKWGASALHHAASQGRLELVRVLISQQADVNVMNQSGHMPLDIAANARISELLRSEAVRRAELRKKHRAKSLTVWSASTIIAVSAMAAALYFLGFMEQDERWLRESHDNSL